MHNILRRRRSEPDESSFNLGENLLDMNEETMELAMEEVEGMDTLKQATQKEEQEVVDIDVQAAGVDVVSRREPDDDNSFDLGENVLDMNEETMELAMGEKEDQETIKEATQKMVEVKDVVEKERAEVETLLQRSKTVDNAFDLGENVLDMNEETMELAMEEEVERRGEGPMEVEDSKETPVQAKVS